jgi:hypothetical protein
MHPMRSPLALAITVAAVAVAVGLVLDLAGVRFPPIGVVAAVAVVTSAAWLRRRQTTPEN